MKALIVITSLWLVTATAGANDSAGRIVGVTDGDTVTLLDASNTQRRIRISGIDAPEKGQPFGERAKLNMDALAYNRDADDVRCDKRDRYGRDVCVVFVGGRDIGLEQIKAGLAWWYRQYAREQTIAQRQDYEMAEAAARAARLGLWGNSTLEPPWEWRHSKKSAKSK